MPHALLILNPVSRLIIFDAAFIRRRTQDHFAAAGWSLEVYETSESEDVVEFIRQALAREPRPDIVIAAGGDGTISSVAEGLIGTDVPLGILPAGTANLLASDLQIPLDLGRALSLFTKKHRLRPIDAMLVNGHYHVLNLGVGMSSQVINATERRQKRLFGVLAYIWNAAVHLIGLKLHRFTVTVDGQTSIMRASEVMVANCGVVGVKPLRWDPGITVDDGVINVCILRTRTIFDFASLLWSALLRRQGSHPQFGCLNAENEITIECEKPMLVEADGDIISSTPIRIQVKSLAVTVIVPERPGAIGVTLGDFRVIRHIPLRLSSRITEAVNDWGKGFRSNNKPDEAPPPLSPEE